MVFFLLIYLHPNGSFRLLGHSDAFSCSSTCQNWVNIMANPPNNNPAMETPKGPRARPLRTTVIKKQEQAAAAAALAAASPGPRGGRTARSSLAGSHDSTIQVLLKLPGFAWEGNQTW